MSPRKDGNAEATWEADNRIDAECATQHPNTRWDIKLNYHRAVMSSASGSRSLSRRWAESPPPGWWGLRWGLDRERYDHQGLASCHGRRWGLHGGQQDRSGDAMS